MRGVAVGLMGLVLAMLIWAVAVESSPPPTPAPPAAAQARADHLVCPLADFVRSETQISLQAGRGGPVPLWNISEGEWVALGEADLGDTGRWMGRAPSGNGVLLAEIGAGWSGAGMVNTAPQAISAWMCGESSDRLMTLGGATLNDDRLDLLLYNPYVLDSLVQVLITSELGEDTPPALREIYVPAGKTVKMSLDEPLRLRRSLAVQADSSPGRIALLLQQTGNGETAMIEGMVPHTEWWLPIPDLGQAEARLLIASPSGSPFTYRLDLMTEDGPLLGFLEEEYLPDQLVSMSLADFPEGVTGIGVSGTVPLVAGLRLEGEGLLAVGPGARGTSERWFLPGAGYSEERESRAWLLNPSGLETKVSISAGSYSFLVTIPPESVLSFDLGLPFDLGKLSGSVEDIPGYLVDAQEEIAVVMTSRLEGKAASYVSGAPVG